MSMKYYTFFSISLKNNLTSNLVPGPQFKSTGLYFFYLMLEICLNFLTTHIVLFHIIFQWLDISFWSHAEQSLDLWHTTNKNKYCQILIYSDGNISFHEKKYGLWTKCHLFSKDSGNGNLMFTMRVIDLHLKVLGAVVLQIWSKYVCFFVFFTWVPLRMLIHADGVIAEVEGDDEHPLAVNWIVGHHLGRELQHISVEATFRGTYTK